MCGYYAPVLPRPFQVFVKPAGAACNLACRYCYYVDTAGDADGVRRIADDLLEAYIAQHIDACPSSEVLFSWHGGEPTLLGVGFFRTVVAMQARHARPGLRIVNGIQTNGVLVTDEWARPTCTTVSAGLAGAAPATRPRCALSRPSPAARCPPRSSAWSTPGTSGNRSASTASSGRSAPGPSASCRSSGGRPAPRRG
jgi:hypothetical protein